MSHTRTSAATPTKSKKNPMQNLELVSVITLENLDINPMNATRGGKSTFGTIRMKTK